MKQYDEIWAIDAERVRLFFKNHADVSVISLPERKLGPINIPQTRIIISGEDADALYHSFFLHFISAGG